MLAHYSISMTSDEKSELTRANRYYREKGFEYFLIKRGKAIHPQIRSALRGWPQLPDERELERLLKKLLKPAL